MATTNTLRPAARAEKAPLVANMDYKTASGEQIHLSANIVRDYLVSGSGKVTDQEVMMFLTLCRYQKLNPFLREAYLIKYGDQPATIVTGKDVLLKRARRQQDFRGLQAGIIVLDSETGAMSEREGTFFLPDVETLVGGWARVYVHGCEHPFYASVSFAEYVGRKKTGEVNGQWTTKPATMIRKVALTHALREAFPEEGSGLYVAEEMGASEEDLPQAEVIVPAEEVKQIPAEAQAPAQPVTSEQQAQKVAEHVEKRAGAAAALFGERREA